jgi:hypothetical protein
MEKKCRHKFQDNIKLDFTGIGRKVVGRIQEACGGNKTGIVQSVW